MTNLLKSLEELTVLFAKYEQSLSAEQGQQVIHLMRSIESALEQLGSTSTNGNPFFEAAIAQVTSPDRKRPTMFVDWMVPFHQAQERVETLLLRAIAYAPHCQSQELEHLQQRQGMVCAMKQLAEAMQKIPAFAKSQRSHRQHEHLRVVETEKGGQP
jgi:hypothetical protein